MKENAINNTKVKRLTRILSRAKSIKFMHNSLYYEIFQSSYTGYVVNVYSHKVIDEYGEYLEKYCIDGGLCTGSVKDAIEFMI